MFLCVGTVLKKMTPPALKIYCGWTVPNVASGFMLCVQGKCLYPKKMTTLADYVKKINLLLIYLFYYS